MDGSASDSAAGSGWKRLITNPLSVLPPALMTRPLAPALASVPPSSIRGLPAYPGCVVPSENENTHILEMHACFHFWYFNTSIHGSLTSRIIASHLIEYLAYIILIFFSAFLEQLRESSLLV